MLAATGVVVMLAGSAARAGDAGQPAAHKPRPAARTYVVRPGDTLWAVAARLAGPAGDPRPVMDDLARVNHLVGALSVGTRLILPA